MDNSNGTIEFKQPRVVDTAEVSYMNVVAHLRRGELGGELGGLGAAGAEEGARLECDDRPRVQSQRPRVRREVAQQARRVEETPLYSTTSVLGGVLRQNERAAEVNSGKNG